MSLTDIISSNKEARGLAIIITNDYTSSPSGIRNDQSSLSHLPGTEIDGRNMCDAFHHLGFVVHWERNISSTRLLGLIHEATNYPAYHKLRNYTCIVFVFSGHGDLGDLVYLQDGSEVSIGDKIINPFLPKSSPNMGRLQKLFFFDACRGKLEMETVMVAKGGSPRGMSDQVGTRGARPIENIRVPAEGGFLVAYSTMSNYQAWEDKTKGGAWLQRLAEKIRNSRDSIEDVLTQVNKDLQDAGLSFVQQPEKLSRLNKIVYLHPDRDQPGKKNRPAIAAVFPSASATSLDHASSQSVEFQDQHIQGVNCDVLHYNKLMSHYPSADFTDYPHVPPELKITYYRSQVTVCVPNLPPIVGDSVKYFVNIQLSRDEAAKNALSKLTTANSAPAFDSLSSHQQSESVDMLPETSRQGAIASSLSSDSSIQGWPVISPVSDSTAQQEFSRSPACLSSLQQMNTFFQKSGIRPQFEYQSDSTRGPTRYRCIVRYTLNSQQKKVDSGHFYLSKANAKEQVAKLVLLRENAGSIVSRGASGTTPLSKVWKSKLKEYCDKKRVSSQEMPVYSTESSGDGFISTVTFIGCMQRGKVCKSKQEAEQSAAQRALQSVPSL